MLESEWKSPSESIGKLEKGDIVAKNVVYRLQYLTEIKAFESRR